MSTVIDFFPAMGQRITFTHWRSLSEPAILPLTTDFFPTNTELSTVHTIISPEREPMHQAALPPHGLAVLA